jgi:hypothetical protein
MKKSPQLEPQLSHNKMRSPIDKNNALHIQAFSQPNSGGLMKTILIALALGFLLTVQTALAAESTGVNQSKGMEIAEQILLQEDLHEQLPAKEEKLNEKKKSKEEEMVEAPLMASASKDGEVDSVVSGGTSIDSAAKLAAAVQDEEAQPAPGSLEFEMATVGLLADAPVDTPSITPAPSNEALAKR